MSGEEIAIAGIVLSAAATTMAPSLAELVKKKITEKKKSLADLHEVLEKGLKDLLALQSEKDGEVWRNKEQKDLSERYKIWKTRVSDIEKMVTSLDEEYKQVKEKKRSHRKRRAHVKKEIKRELNEVIDLIGKCKDMNVRVDKLPERVKKEYDVPPPIANYQTLEKAFQDVRSLLQNDKVKCVALYGQKGAGKTTIMQHLYNHHFYDSSDNKEFDMVIFIKVAAAGQTDGRTECLHIMQKIAERMMEDTKGNECQVAERIQGGLKNKRYLLILDGVRYAFAVDRILGKLDISGDKKDSKVVITTHYPLAWKSKYVKRKVELKPLSLDEALGMFRNIVGDNHLPDKGIAQLVCKKFCWGLPFLIDRIATSFKYQEPPIDWQRTLNECTPWPQVARWQRDLKERTPGPQLGDDDLEDLYSNLEICFRMLGDQSIQKCFLYASLYPANSNIYTDYFVECCIAQGFLGDVGANTKYSEMRRRAKDVTLRHLVNVAFLEEGEQRRYVKMSDLYRQLALHISSKDSNSDYRTYVDNEEHEEAFRSESWHHARWVSMVGSNRDSLPRNQNCGSLQTLLLQKNLKLVEIPPAYFDSMGNLLVLNLYGTKISKLPSLEGLIGLKAFYLNQCSELKICSTEIQPLQRLEVFDIRGTRVDFVPCLESLRCLRISYIASGDQSGNSSNYHPISVLHKLEELTIEVKSLPQWCNDAEYILQKVASLENLTTFRCSFSSSESLGKFLEACKSWKGQKQFASFQFFVGCEDSKRPKISEDRISKYVKYCNGDEKGDSAITEVLSQAEAFELICHSNVASLRELARTSNLEYLRVLLIEGCNKMVLVVNGTLPENASLLPNLDQLHLDNLQNLFGVFEGPFYPGSFAMLRTLTLKNCPKLAGIFFETAVDDFPELQNLEVQNCSNIEFLIQGQSILPRLKMLILDNLLNLQYICQNENLAWGSLEQLNVQNCPKLKTLPFNTTNATNLRTIKGEIQWWSNLEWSHHEVKERFESAFSAS